MLTPLIIFLTLVPLKEPQVAMQTGETKQPIVYFIPFDIDTNISVTPEKFVASTPSRSIKVEAVSLKKILRFIEKSLPPCKDDPLTFATQSTRLLIRLPDETILVDTQGVVLRGKALTRMTPSGFLRLNTLLEQFAYEQGKSLKSMPPPQ